MEDFQIEIPEDFCDFCDVEMEMDYELEMEDDDGDPP